MKIKRHAMFCVGRHRGPVFRPCQLVAGFTLIETLVTAALIGVALLGLSALQVWSLSSVNDIRFHHHARNLATEIVEHMRVSGASNLSAFVSAGNSETCDSLETSVTPLQILACWQAAVGDKLPSGAGEIAVDASQNIVTITLSWAWRGEPANGDDPPRHTLIWKARL